MTEKGDETVKRAKERAYDRRKSGEWDRKQAYHFVKRVMRMVERARRD
ncbi:MAG: hypothetical protein R6X31_13860 [Anaerolineae bacterium]